MTQITQNRMGSIVMLVNALLLIAAGIAVVLDPNGGLTTPTAPLLYYVALMCAVFSGLALFARLGSKAGRTGAIGFLLATVGAVLYSAPAYVLVAGTSGIAAWHDLWAFAMGNVLPLGALLFFVGWILLGVACARSGILPRGSGWLITAGYAVWLVAFFPVSALLPIANWICGIGLGWAGLAMLAKENIDHPSSLAVWSEG
jgi:hypothetical protein